MSTSPKRFAEVHQAELEELAERRRNAGLDAQASDSPTDPLRDRTGLALSGGGIRSASFNLGLIQALNQEHVLSQIDYMSTVSGGGYIGSHLSSLASITHSFDEVTESAGGKQVDETATHERAKSMLAEGPTGQQPASVRRLIRGGMYLNKPFSFFSRYALGLIAINLSLVSSLVLVCATTALTFRCLDLPPVMDFLWACGFNGDVLRAFAPAAVCGSLWIMTWVLGYLFGLASKERRINPRLSTFFFGATVVFALLAIAALLGTGDISFSALRLHFDVQPDSARVGTIQQALVVAGGIVLVLALLPYIRPQRLIRSATNPKNHLETIAFKVASNAMLLGIPLMLFGFLAAENVSLRNARRPGRYSVARTSLRWDSFWTKVNNERSVLDESVEDHPSIRFWQVAGSNPMKAAEYHRQVNELDRHSWLFARLIHFPQRWATRVHYNEARDGVAEAINEKLLGHADFHESFASLKSPSDELTESRNKAAAAAHDFLEAKNAYERENTAEKASTVQHYERQLRVANWELTAAHYGKDAVRSLDTIFAFNVTRFGEFGDQGWRISVIWISGLVFLLSGCFVNLNVTSIHGFYRDQLARMWLATSSKKHNKTPVIPLSELRNSEVGLPYHIINCTLNFIGRGHKRGRTSLFVMSKRFCGSDVSEYLESDHYMGGSFDLANAMAVSGAAVSPTVFNNWFLVAFLLVSNMRLGQWLHNPGKRPRKPWPLDLPMQLPPAAIPIGIEYLICSPEVRQYCFITDGGHHENLGVESLLRRRCRVIICSDAGADPNTTFLDLTQLIRRMRIEEGIRFIGVGDDDNRVILDPLIPRTGMCQSHFIVLKILYPSAIDDADEVKQEHQIDHGYLIYVKSSLTGDEDVDLMRHKSAHRNFPHDATVDQFYDEQRFESYRQLGHHIGVEVCEELFGSMEHRNQEAWLACWQPSDRDESTGPSVSEDISQKRPR